ncbi:UPF0311 protein [Penicillium chrysogenum]|jgi:hypothetical protein|uniref:UPF0311 protein n=1 Tax=Penicillium chrysogenum TaxID=5076 RepID=A0A167YMM1_PENCH|nr:uncharacterized protein N7525_010222 [Penicillium rubens]KAJ5035909.1 hypothetical protein NUH16_003770 [Penicillium rubens]KAJ5820938.1 hypothetical protein N7525_010222 [Penicillium rubens]KAJ5858586.1 hypothetical protein N7534_003863 [Penicillium rubens]KZN94310.1 UPF0311 protein [Penicillium chrysogenum]
MALPEVPPAYVPRHTSTLKIPELKKRLGFKTEYLFTYTMQLPEDDPPFIIGNGADGISMIITERGTRVSGPRINGSFIRDGNDYVTLRPDGSSIHEVRCVILTDDGARIKFTYKGKGDFGPTGYQDVLDGKMPEKVKIKCGPHMETAHPAYQWVNGVQCLEVGEVNVVEKYGTFDCYAII